MARRATVIVIDSFGIGALPDAENYGDTGANTALHICEHVPGEKWPVLTSLGMGNASETLLSTVLPGCPGLREPIGSWGVMDEKSPGKDTTTGHWEIAGIVLEKAFAVFPSSYPSFPPEFVKEFERETGRGILGDRAASGTEIIQELGEEQLSTGKLICYTSADSVFQIAAHEDMVPLEELYAACRTARRLLDTYRIARVIARPFTGVPGNFTRTKNRKDFSIALPAPSLLDVLKDKGLKTTGVGKIGNIFNEQGLVTNYADKGNAACLERTAFLLSKAPREDEFVFVNLVDTDMIYGHRRDTEGYFGALKEIDTVLGTVIDNLSADDLLIITADHGCDPTFRGTDHTREYVPLLVYRKGSSSRNLGIRSGHDDIAATICAYFGLEAYGEGKSFQV